MVSKPGLKVPFAKVETATFFAPSVLGRRAYPHPDRRINRRIITKKD